MSITVIAEHIRLLVERVERLETNLGALEARENGLRGDVDHLANELSGCVRAANAKGVVWP